MIFCLGCNTELTEPELYCLSCRDEVSNWEQKEYQRIYGELTEEIINETGV